MNNLIKEEKDLVVVMCPPLSSYKEAPKDHSHSELFECPKCKEKMWLSERKKGILMFASCLNKEILLGCYHCIKKITEDDPSLFSECEMVNL
jgi:hypothetical protein